MRRAAIDIGSNSVKLLVADRNADGCLVDIEEQMEVTRLSHGIGGHGLLAEAPIARTVNAVAAFVARARELGAAEIVARGTAGLRNAANPEIFLDRVVARCGVRVEVISGEEEARLAYLAGYASAPAGCNRIAVVDIGGASTEFTFGQGATMAERMSLPVGAVRLTEAFLASDPAAPDEVERLLAHVREVLEAPRQMGPVDAVVGIGGTFTDLTGAHLEMRDYDSARIEGTRLVRPALDALVTRLGACPTAERKKVPGLTPKRADVILAGAYLAREIPDVLGTDGVIISRRGLRHGLLF